MISAIFVEAGHGLSASGIVDNGASANGFTERDLVVHIAKLVFFNLKEKGSGSFEVIDVGINKQMSLSNKINFINTKCKENKWNENNSLLVSIHVNSGKASGVEGWYYAESDISKKFASNITDSLSKNTGLKNRGVKPDKSNKHGRLAIVRDTTPLACLLECGFISTEADCNLLTDHTVLFSSSIIEGINAYAQLNLDLGNNNFTAISYELWEQNLIKIAREAGIVSDLSKQDIRYLEMNRKMIEYYLRTKS
jgi:N-acetylmuramoyl-L-alanine amidase